VADLARPLWDGRNVSSSEVMEMSEIGEQLSHFQEVVHIQR
jgi:hypothetical protein